MNSALFQAVLFLAVAVSADVRDALRNSRQAIILNPVLQRPQLQLVAQPVLVQPQFEQRAFQQQSFVQQPQWRILQHTQEADDIGNYRFK